MTFNAIDFTNHFDDADSDSLIKIQITSLPANGILKLSGSNVTLNQEINVEDLGNLTFDPNANWYGNTSFVWKGFDGAEYSVSSANVNIQIDERPDAPIITTTSSTLEYTENDGAVIIDNGLTVVDKDNENLTGATVSITSGFSSSEDSLSFTNQFGITGNYNNGTGVLALSGTSTLANYQTALRSVKYINNSEKPTVVNREVSFQVTDGIDDSNVATRTINIIGVPDKPTITDVLKSGKNDADVTFSASDFTGVYSDLDGDSMTQIQIVSLPNASQGVLKLSGSVVSDNQVIATSNLNSLVFEPATGWNDVASFDWRAYDDNISGSVESNIASVHIEITNSVPTISNISKFGKLDDIIFFDRADFDFVFNDADENDVMVGIRISDLTNPAHGKLVFNSNTLSKNKLILSDDIDLLSFHPDPNWKGGETTFSWQAYDGKDYSSPSLAILDIDNSTGTAKGLSGGVMAGIIASGGTVVGLALTAAGVAATYFGFLYKFRKDGSCCFNPGHWCYCGGCCENIWGENTAAP